METALETSDIFYAFGAALRILMLTAILALIVQQPEDRYLKHESLCALIKFL